jgi:hypothetical protein
LKPPILDGNGELIKNLKEVELTEWQQILDALWSDPRQEKGIKENIFRGGGCCFGLVDRVFFCIMISHVTNQWQNFGSRLVTYFVE